MADMAIPVVHRRHIEKQGIA